VSVIMSLLCVILPPPYDLHAQSLCIDQVRDVCDHHSSYPLACVNYQSFDHDVNCYPYYDVTDESYAGLNAMIETMIEQHTCFVSEMWEYGLLQETDPNLPFPRLERVVSTISMSLPFP